MGTAGAVVAAGVMKVRRRRSPGVCGGEVLACGGEVWACGGEVLVSGGGVQWAAEVVVVSEYDYGGGGRRFSWCG
jgi:hypothetical protein